MHAAPNLPSQHENSRLRVRSIDRGVLHILDHGQESRYQTLLVEALLARQEPEQFHPRLPLGSLAIDNLIYDGRCHGFHDGPAREFIERLMVGSKNRGGGYG